MNPIVQQQVLNSLFTRAYGIEDGIYVLMKNGYYHYGQFVLFVDPVVIVYNLILYFNFSFYVVNV